MTQILKRTYGLLFVSFIFAMASCSNDNAVQTATLQVHLTDAPGDYQEVNIDIQDVQVQSGDTTGSDSGWKSLEVQKGVYNLLKFTNGLDTLLGTAVLPAGKVGQIRLILGDNNTVKVDDQSYKLTTPSAQHSGLKVLVNTTLSGGVTYKITLDFDAARSIVRTGNGKYILKPVIRSVVAAQSGAIKGAVTPVESTPVVYALMGVDTVASTSADQTTGKFMIGGLAAGSYTVTFAPKTGYKADTVKNVSVTVGSVTDLGTVQIMQ